MSTELAVDVTSLGTIASKLTVTTQTLGDLAPGAPQAVSASAGAAATAAIVQHLITQSAYLCADLEVASDGVTTTRDEYGATDDTTWTTLRALGTLS